MIIPGNLFHHIMSIITDRYINGISRPRSRVIIYKVSSFATFPPCMPLTTLILIS